MFTVRGEITKFLINERIIARAKDARHLSFKQLVGKYLAVIQTNSC